MKKINIDGIKYGDLVHCSRLIGCSTNYVHEVLNGNIVDRKGVIPLLHKIAQTNKEIERFAEKLKLKG